MPLADLKAAAAVDTEFASTNTPHWFSASSSAAAGGRNQRQRGADSVAKPADAPVSRPASAFVFHDCGE